MTDRRKTLAEMSEQDMAPASPGEQAARSVAEKYAGEPAKTAYERMITYFSHHQIKMLIDDEFRQKTPPREIHYALEDVARDLMMASALMTTDPDHSATAIVRNVAKRLSQVFPKMNDPTVTGRGKIFGLLGPIIPGDVYVNAGTVYQIMECNYGLRNPAYPNVIMQPLSSISETEAPKVAGLSSDPKWKSFLRVFSVDEAEKNLQKEEGKQ